MIAHLVVLGRLQDSISIERLPIRDLVDLANGFRVVKAAKDTVLGQSHESKKSLEIYQHLSLGAVEQVYQEAVQAEQ